MVPALAVLAVVDGRAGAPAGGQSVPSAPAHFLLTSELRRPEDVAQIRGKQISEVLPLPAVKREEPQVEEAAAAVAAIEEEKPKPRARKKKDETDA